MRYVLALLLLASPVHAVLPQDAQLEILDDYSGGLNTEFPSFKIPNNFSPFMRNVFIDDGRIRRINGFETIGGTSTLNEVNGIYPFVKETGETTFLVTDSSSVLETTDFSFTSPWTEIKMGQNTAGLTRCIQVQNKMWCFNGLDSVFTWDGSTTVVLDGSGDTPDVPRFRYGAFYQERVFGLNRPGNASSLRFSAVTSTDGAILAPDDIRAWPATNELFIGEGDGQLGTALWISRGQLRIGKERSIYTLFGTNEFNYVPRKEEAQVGVASQDSVVVMDGESHFVAEDGIYRDTNRISDLITPDFEAINRETLGVTQVVYDDQADFLPGLFSGSTATISGFLTIDGKTFLANDISDAVPSDQFITLSDTGTMATDFGVFTSTKNVPENYYGFINNVTIWARCPGATCNIALKVRNSRTQDVVEFRKNIGVNPFTQITFGQGQSENTPTPFLPNVFFTAQDITDGNMEIQVSTGLGSGLPGGALFDFYAPTTTANATIELAPSTTVQFISDVATTTGKTAFGSFDSEDTTDGGSIDYFIRSSNEVDTVSTQTWTSISPGAIIPFDESENFQQWATTITSISTTPLVTNIDVAIINYVTGGSAFIRPLALDWKNRYWLAVTTTTDEDMSLFYVKSRDTNPNPNAWMPIQGINVAAFAKQGDTFYAGSSSSGTIYRLDFGTNFDGSSIESIYDTPDMIMGNNFFDKQFMKYVVDAQQDDDLVLSIGSSIELRDFSTVTRSFDGNTRQIGIIEGVRDRGKSLRLRLSNSQLDKEFEIFNLSVIYQPTRVLK